MIEDRVILKPVPLAQAPAPGLGQTAYTVLRIASIGATGIAIGWFIGLMVGLFTGLIPFSCSPLWFARARE